jgi:hypothetical protein
MSQTLSDVGTIAGGLGSGAATGAAIGGPVGGIVGGVIGLGLGIYQVAAGISARKKAERDRPTYQIPPEIYQNLSAAERLVYEGMPAAQKNQFLRTIQRTEATMLARSGELQQGLSGLAAATQASADAAGNMAVADAQMRQRAEANLANQRNILAQYKDKEFNIDQSNFMYERDRADAMIGAGMQNIYKGVDMGVRNTVDLGVNQDWFSGNNRKGGTGNDGAVLPSNEEVLATVGSPLSWQPVLAPTSGVAGGGQMSGGGSGIASSNYYQSINNLLVQ